MSNPHRVKLIQQPAQEGGLFSAHCVADGCDAQWGPDLLTDLYRKAVQHQMNAANTRTIYRRADWQEPVEDT